MKTKRMLLVLMALLMLCPILSACGGGNGNSGDTNVPIINNEAINGDNQNEYVKDDLPDTLDYGGAEFTVLCGETRYGKSWNEVYTGDTVNSAVYERQAAIEERLNIDFVFDLQPDGYNDMSTFIQHLENAANNGDAPDLVQTYNLTPALMATRGLCSDLAQTEYLNFEKPWWSATLLENTAINGKVYFTTDNCSWNNLRNMIAIFVDKKLFDDFHYGKGIDTLYDMVDNKTWTMENMFELVSNCYVNTNGDADVNDGDTFGLSVASQAWMESWYYAAGFTTMEQDANGVWSFNIATTEVIDFIDWFRLKFYNNDACAKDAKQYRQFCNGQAMFYLSSLALVEQKIANPFAVLPLPMYTAEQGAYYTHFSNTYDMYAIPRLCEDQARASAVFECMASEAYRQIAPAYFENYLKVRNATDGRLQKMYDIIRESAVFDMGISYSAALNISGINGAEENYPQYFVRRSLHNTPKWESLGAIWTTDVNMQYLSLWKSIQDQLTALQ